MDFGKMLQDSFDYTKEAVWEKWMKWILLIVSSIIFPLMWGYALEIVRGKKPAPELQNWVKLFIDGLKLLVIIIIYAIPVVIVLAIFVGFALFSAMAGGPTPYFTQPAQIMPLLIGFFTGVFIAGILAVILALFETIGVIRFARLGRVSEAFNFGAIVGHIGKIGWISYIVALIIIFVVYGIISFIVQLIPFFGFVLNIILMPVYYIFISRYLTQVYDSVPA